MLLECLEKDAEAIFRSGGRWSCSLFAGICAQWRAWKVGVSPTRKPRGFNRQNPLLLEAFARLDSAEVKAQQPVGPGPADSTTAFEQRILSQMGPK